MFIWVKFTFRNPVHIPSWGHLKKGRNVEEGKSRSKFKGEALFTEVFK